MSDLKKADIEQINEAVRGGNINAARRILRESDDPRAKDMLTKLNAKYPPPPIAPDANRPIVQKADDRLPWEVDDPKPARVVSSLKRPAAPSSSLANPPGQSVRAELPPSLQTDLDGEMGEIKQAIRDRRYDDARTMLIVSDHPDADKMLARLSQIDGGVSVPMKVKREYAETDKDFTGQLTITIFLLLFLGIFGLIALAIWLPEAKKYPNAPGAQGLILTNKVVTFILRGILAFLVFMILLSIIFSVMRF